jgi:hypothetical protein
VALQSLEFLQQAPAVFFLVAEEAAAGIIPHHETFSTTMQLPSSIQFY